MLRSGFYTKALVPTGLEYHRACTIPYNHASVQSPPAYNHRQRTFTAVSWLCYITYEICNFIRVKPMNKCSSFKMPLYRIQTLDFFSSLHIILLLN